MSDDWTEVDSFRDASGKRISVGYAGSLARVAVLSPAGVVLAAIVLDGDQRDRFIKAYAEAERQAEACPAEAVLPGERYPCTLRRGHGPDHVFAGNPVPL